MAESLLRVSITDDTQLLLQGELLAIQKGLEFVENKSFGAGSIKGTYRGYVNSDGEREGVGVTIFDDGDKGYAEYHNNELHGIAKIKWADGNSYLGEVKHHCNDGYGTFHWGDTGETYTGQFKNGKGNGYGVYTWPDG